MIHGCRRKKSKLASVSAIVGKRRFALFSHEHAARLSCSLFLFSLCSPPQRLQAPATKGMHLSRGGKAGQGRAGQGMAGHGDQGGQDMWPVPATIPATVVALQPTTIFPPVCPIQVEEGRYVKVKDHSTR